MQDVPHFYHIFFLQIDNFSALFFVNNGRLINNFQIIKLLVNKYFYFIFNIKWIYLNRILIKKLFYHNI